MECTSEVVGTGGGGYESQLAASGFLGEGWASAHGAISLGQNGQFPDGPLSTIFVGRMPTAPGRRAFGNGRRRGGQLRRLRSSFFVVVFALRGPCGV